MMHPSVRQLLRNIFHDEINMDMFRAFIARTIAAFGSLLLIGTMGRVYGADGVGVLALGQSILLGASVISKYGMDNGLMRFVGKDRFSLHVYKLLYWSSCVVLIYSFIVALIIFLSRDLLEQIFNSKGLSEVLVGISIATPAFTLGYLISGFFKGVGKPATATMLEGGYVALLAAIVLLLLYVVNDNLDIGLLGVAYALAAWIVVIRGIWSATRWFHYSRAHLQTRDLVLFEDVRREFVSSSTEFFLMSLATLMQSVLTVLIAGVLLTSDDLGLYKLSEQISLVISFILIVLNAVLPPRFANFFLHDRINELEKVARKGAKIGLLLASPMLVIGLAFPHWLLGLIGEDFVSAAPLLRILAFAQVINLATGSVGFMLAMTGYERLMRNISWSCSIVGLLLFLILIPLFGVLGAAIGLAVMLVMQNLLALYYVWEKIGIWVVPAPNVFQLIGLKTRGNK